MRQGGLVIKHEKVDTCQLIADVVDMTQALVPRPVELINLVGDMPVIVADSDRLTQIMFNLVGNAGICDASFQRRCTFSINCHATYLQPSSQKRGPSPYLVA